MEQGFGITTVIKGATLLRTLIGVTTITVALGAMGTSASYADSGTRGVNANTHLKRGLSFYNERAYERAIVEFKAGYEAEPRREFLFALGQAERLAGDCPSAIVYYRKFLSRSPNKRQAAAAWDNLRRCQRALASGPDRRDPAHAMKRLMSDPEQPKTKAQPRAQLPWYRDKVGGALLAGGVAMVAVGGGFISWAGSAESNASSAVNYSKYASGIETAKSRRNLGMASLATGGALIAGAVYRYVTRSGSSTERVGVNVDGGGIALSFGGSF